MATTSTTRSENPPRFSAWMSASSRSRSLASSRRSPSSLSSRVPATRARSPRKSSAFHHDPTSATRFLRPSRFSSGTGGAGLSARRKPTSQSSVARRSSIAVSRSFAASSSSSSLAACAIDRRSRWTGVASTRSTRPPVVETRTVSRKTAPGRLGKWMISTPALPGARPRRRTRARSLNTVTSAIGASITGALSAVFGDSTTAGTFSAATAGATGCAPTTTDAATTIAKERRREVKVESSAASGPVSSCADQDNPRSRCGRAPRSSSCHRRRRCRPVSAECWRSA